MRVLIAGLGSMGSAAVYFLSKQGIDVIGIDPYQVPHSMGSHSGHTRFIRKSYFEHPDYVPLLERAYQLWYEIERNSGLQLFHQTGLHYFGSSDCDQNLGVKLSSQRHHIPIEIHSKEKYVQQYMDINIPNHWEAIAEQEAGYLEVEKSLSYFLKEATHNQAVFHTGEKMIRWETVGHKIKVFTDKTEYIVDKLILTGGAGMPDMLGKALNLDLKITRQIVSWFMPDDPSSYRKGSFPCFTIRDPKFDGIFYGFPISNELQGLKFAHHAPAIEGSKQSIEEQIASENQKLLAVLNHYFPDTKWSHLNSLSCLYTYSKDEDFIIDFYPGTSNVILAGGFSGHGFKFVPVVAEIIGELCSKGYTEHTIKKFAVGR